MFEILKYFILAAVPATSCGSALKSVTVSVANTLQRLICMAWILSSVSVFLSYRPSILCVGVCRVFLGEG